MTPELPSDDGGARKIEVLDLPLGEESFQCVAEAVAKAFPPETASSAKSARKPKAPAAWRSLPPAELAAHLLATRTIADFAWTTEPRLPRENRESFIRRIVLGETQSHSS